MKKIYLLVIFGLCIFLGSCSDVNHVDNYSMWSCSSMTSDDGTTFDFSDDLSMTMVCDEFFDKHLGETIFTITRETRGITTHDYYVRKENKLYETNVNPQKYLIFEDKATGKTRRSLNENWKNKHISWKSNSSYTIKEQDGKTDLFAESGIIFHLEPMNIQLVK